MADCKKCKADCCRYVTAILEKPKDKEDWDEIKWHVMHKGVMVYLDHDGDWNVEVKTPCMNLDKKTYLCKIHKVRPQTCRDHGTHECEANDQDFAEVIFNKPEDVDKYLKKKK